MPSRRSLSPLIPHWTVLSNTAGSSVASTHSDDEDDGPVIIPNKKRKARVSAASRSQPSKASNSREEARRQGRSRSRSTSLEDRIMPSIDRMESLSQPVQRKEQARKRTRSGRRVSTQSLIKDAQKPTGSGAATRVRKTVRKSTNLKPLRRKTKDVIELTDSDDSEHRAHRALGSSQVAGPSRPSEVIVLSSSSEGENQPAPKRVRVQSGPLSASQRLPSNPSDVISFQTSDEGETLPPGDVDDLPMFQPQSRDPSPVPFVSHRTTALPITPAEERDSAVIETPAYTTPLPPVSRPAVLRRSIFLPIAQPIVPSPSAPARTVDTGLQPPSSFASHSRDTTETSFANKGPAATQPVASATQPRLRINEIRVKGSLCNTSFFSRALGQMPLASTQPQRPLSSTSASSSSVPSGGLASTPNSKAPSTPMIVHRPRPQFPSSSSPSVPTDYFETSRITQSPNGTPQSGRQSPAKAPLSLVRRESGLANLSGEMSQLHVEPEKEVTPPPSPQLRSDTPSNEGAAVAMAEASEDDFVEPGMADDMNPPDEDNMSWDNPNNIEIPQIDQVMGEPEMDDTVRETEAYDPNGLYAEPTSLTTESPAQHPSTATLPRLSMVHLEEFSGPTTTPPVQPLSSVSNSDESSPVLTYPSSHATAKSTPGIPDVPLAEEASALTQPEVTEAAMPDEGIHRVSESAVTKSPSLPESPAPSMSSAVPIRVGPPSRSIKTDYASTQRPVSRRGSSSSQSVGSSSLLATKAPKSSQSNVIPPPRVPRRSGPDLTLAELINQVRETHLQREADRERRRGRPGTTDQPRRRVSPEIVDLTQDVDNVEPPPPLKMSIVNDPGQAVFERLLVESRKYAAQNARLEKSGPMSSSQQSPRSTEHVPFISLTQPPRSARKPAHSPSSSLTGPRATLKRERLEQGRRHSTSNSFSSFIRREPSRQATSSTVSPPGNALGSGGSPVSSGFNSSTTRPASRRSRLSDIAVPSSSQTATPVTPTDRPRQSPNITGSSNKIDFASLIKLDLDSVSKNKQKALAKDTTNKAPSNKLTKAGSEIPLGPTNAHDSSNTSNLSTSLTNPMSVSFDHQQSQLLVASSNTNTITPVAESSNNSKDTRPLSSHSHLPAEQQPSNSLRAHSLSNIGCLPSPSPSNSVAPASGLAKTPMHPSPSPLDDADVDDFRDGDVGEVFEGARSNNDVTLNSHQDVLQASDDGEEVSAETIKMLEAFLGEEVDILVDSNAPAGSEDDFAGAVKPVELLQLSTMESDHDMDTLDPIDSVTNDVDSKISLTTHTTTEGTIASPVPDCAPDPVSSSVHPDSDAGDQNQPRLALRREINLPVHSTDFMTASHSLPTPALSVSPVVVNLVSSDEEQDEEEAVQIARAEGKRRAQSVVQSGDSSEDEVAHLVETDTPSVEMSEHSNGYINSTASSTAVSSGAESSRKSLVSSRPSSVDPMDIIDDEVEYMVNGKPLPKLAGHYIVRWEAYAYFAKRRPLEYLLAKNLPHSLEDRMNSMSEDFRNSDHARVIFEAAIQQNTDDEPLAPHIQIYNEVDEEATPPWEFHYTNRMWYGEGIPPPDVKNLASCNCQGKCNPKSRTCVCLKRQRQWLDKYVEGGSLDKKDAMGFLYDEKGRLRMQDFPIFECNQFCGCDEGCTNRVVQNGRKCTVNIVKTENKGWGVFAWNKKIPKGTYIGIYAGELLTEQEGEIRGKVYNKIGRTYLFDVDFSHLKGLFGTSDEAPEWENRYVVDAFHAGNFTRFLNHSCNPNCTIVACYIDEANIEKPLLTVFTSRDVEPYEELCFSYAGIDDEDPSEEDLKNDAVYGRCYCGSVGCRGRMFS